MLAMRWGDVMVVVCFASVAAVASRWVEEEQDRAYGMDVEVDCSLLRRGL